MVRMCEHVGDEEVERAKTQVRRGVRNNVTMGPVLTRQKYQNPQNQNRDWSNLIGPNLFLVLDQSGWSNFEIDCLEF